MNLKNYEKDVLELLLTDKVNSEIFEKSLSTVSVSNYKFTGTGYFIDVNFTGINFGKETISKPLIIGEFIDIHVGFVLYVDKNTVTIECHGWSDKNLPENIREISLIISRGAA